MKKISIFLLIMGMIRLLMPLSMVADDTELGVYEQLDNYIPGDVVLVSEDHEKINLLDFIDKPTVLVPVYYECPGICSPLLEGVAEVISRADLELGKDYQVVTFSFDHTEGSDLARAKKMNYSRLVSGNNDVANGWLWFTADSSNVYKLLNSIGYKVKKEGDEFIHPGAIVVLSPDGKITRYLHGTYFLPFDLKMAVAEASRGKSGPTINKVLQFCFSYDPKGKKYVFNITKISGSIIILMALGLFMTLFLKRNRKKIIKKEQ